MDSSSYLVENAATTTSMKLEAIGRDSIMDLRCISVDVDIIENACAMESIVDELRLEIGDAFELHKQQQEATRNTSTLVYGRTRFAVPKTEKELVKVRKTSVPKKNQTDTKYYMFIFSNVHELFPVFLYTLATYVIIMSLFFNNITILLLSIPEGNLRRI